MKRTITIKEVKAMNISTFSKKDDSPRGCKIEIIGTWIWVSGNTKEYKDQLKELHFTWSKNKAAWNFHSEPFKKKSRNSLDFDTIRSFYGSSEIETQPQTKIS